MTFVQPALSQPNTHRMQRRQARSVPMLTHAAVSAAQRSGWLEPRGARQRWLPLKRKAGTFLPRIALMVLFPCSNAGVVGGWGENRSTDSSWVLTRTFHSFCVYVYVHVCGVCVICVCVVCERVNCDRGGIETWG